LENIGGTLIYGFQATGVALLGTGGVAIYPSSDADTVAIGGSGLVVNVAPGGVGLGIRANNNITAGMIGFRMAGSFVPTTGSGTYNAYVAVPTINQTGTSDGEIVYFNGSATVTNVRGKIVAFRHNSGFVQWNSIVTPSQITSNQDDYNPPSWTTGAAPGSASIMRLSSDAAHNITSLQGGFVGRLAIIANVGSFTITLKNDDGATGTAANRFSLNADRAILAGQAVFLYYDGTLSRWKLIS
jgi:hypothetical protein